MMKLEMMNNRWMSLLFLAAAFAMIYNPLTKFPYTFCLIILIIGIFTYLQDGHLKALNFKKLGFREIKIILICYVIMELAMDFILQPVISRIVNEPADYSIFKPIEGNTRLYFKWLSGIWISAAVGEELLFRSFAFAQLQRIIGNRKVIIILTSAILFCIPHLYQGISGLVQTFIYGIALGFIYAKFENIWINIIVHGLTDTLFLTLSYYGLMDFYTIF